MTANARLLALALDRPVRPFLIAAGVLIASSLCAHANLGDTFIDANKRWGLPVVEYTLPDGYKAIYGSRGWVITQIWDHNNLAVAVIYYKEWTGGNITWITRDEINDLWLANTRGQGEVHWVCSTDSTPQTMIWSSPDIPAIVHVEIIPSGTHWTHCLSVVASPEAAQLLLDFKHTQ
jgi:hypothetical protein